MMKIDDSQKESKQDKEKERLMTALIILEAAADEQDIRVETQDCKAVEQSGNDVVKVFRKDMAKIEFVIEGTREDESQPQSPPRFHIPGPNKPI
jgi:hypothetical protein